MTQRKRRQESLAYRLILPYVGVLVLLMFYPITYNIVRSLVVDGRLSLANYTSVLSEGSFARLSLNTAIWVVGSVTFQFALGLGIALLLNQRLRLRGLWRVLILVIPWATPDIVAGVAWQWMLNDMYGVFNDVLVKLGILNAYLPWLGEPALARWSVIIANTWKGFALSAMFYLAALQTVPTELHEAAFVDGANIIQRFLYVTWPHIRPFVATTVMLTVIWTFNYFPLIYTMTGGGPAGATDTYVTHAYRLAFRFTDFGRSSALSTLTFAFVMLFAAIYSSILLLREEAA
ncbi:MAG: sugar ABC transporter permease [Limnochordaceae bacterium]|nr:sugar ABC transporter permease [Limnochordaceae bacterium]